jgi:hypothetical protein
MTVRFEALPVGRGDAFLLRRDDTAFLFDGGQYVHQVSGFLQSKGLLRLKVIICSHNDSDHANGLIGLLKSSVEVDEVWLPVSWVEFLQAALVQGDPWPVCLLREVQDAQGNAGSLEDIYNSSGENDEAFYQSDEAVDVQLERLMDAWLGYEDYNELLPPIRWSPFWFPAIMGDKLFWDALFAGERIRKLMRLAYHRGCLIRFFQYSSPKGMPPFNRYGFVPINAIEVGRMRKARTLLRILALTQANRESLVFRCELDGDTCVLFTADSDLGFLKGTPISVAKSSIITAPHHGSSDNASAYSLIIGNDLKWVRSDMKTMRRPCSEFRQQPVRFCTICPQATGSRQNVELRFARGRWKPAPTTSACQCH